MEFWICCIVFLLSSIGCVLLGRTRQSKENKGMYTLGMIGLAALALLSLGYLLLTVFFLNSIP